MGLHLTTKVGDLSDGQQRVVNHPATDSMPNVVSIRLSDNGTMLFIYTAADADELIEWATAAKKYLTQAAP